MNSTAKKLLHGALFLLPLILATVGLVYAGEKPLDAMFSGVIMYALNYGDSPPNLTVQVARWTAPLATATGVALAFAPVLRRVRAKLLYRTGKSVAVYGDEEIFELLKKAPGIRAIRGETTLLPAHRYVLFAEEEENLRFYMTHRPVLEQREVVLRCSSLRSQELGGGRLHLYSMEEVGARLFWKQAGLLRQFSESGRELPEIEIDAAELAAFNWLPNLWGMDCILEVGKGTKEHVRYAAQTTARHAEHQTVYTVTGWRKIDGRWVFLLPGNEEYTVSLSNKMHGYGMAEEASGLDLAILTRLLTAGPVTEIILFPLLALVFLSPLNHFLKLANCEPKFVLFLIGRTGTRKSTLAALMLSFFGSFTATDLPMSFQDTANSIAYNSFALKDVLTCIDDFHPATRYEEQKQTATAQTILRVYGDRAAKGRLRSDCSPMEARPPQGNAIVTAEFPPDIGESGTARYLALELKPQDVDLDVLTYFQNQAAEGVLARCMRSYLEWLKKSYLLEPDAPGGLLLLLKDNFRRYREAFRRSKIPCHGRVAETVAWLQIGMDYLLMFLTEANAMDPMEASKLKDRFRDLLYELARTQAASIAEDRPAARFLRKLLGMLEAGQVCVLPKDEDVDYQPPNWIGYQDKDCWYLFTDPVHKAVREQCERQGESFTISSKELLKALAEENCLDCSPGLNTKKIRVGGRSKRVVCIYKDRAREIAEGPAEKEAALAEAASPSQEVSQVVRRPAIPCSVSDSAVPLP